MEDSGLVPLAKIFEDWREGSELVLSSYARHVGCRIADLDYRVPEPLRAFLDGQGEPSGFAFNFEVSGALAGINAILKENPTPQGTAGNLMLGDVNAMVTREGRRPTELGSWISYHAPGSNRRRARDSFWLPDRHRLRKPSLALLAEPGARASLSQDLRGGDETRVRRWHYELYQVRV